MLEADRVSHWGTLWVASAAFLWGLAGGIAGFLMASGWDAFVVTFYRGAIGLVVIMLWLLIAPRDSGLFQPRMWAWALLAGLGVTGNFTFYFLSIAEGSVAVAATLMYCAPVFVFLISTLLRIETPTALKGVCMVGVLIGIVMLTRIYEAAGSDVTLAAILFGLLAGLSYTLFIFGFKYAAPYGSPQAILLIAFAVLVALLALPSDPVQIQAVVGAEERLVFVSLGVFGAGLSFFLYIVGLRRTTPTTASIVAMVEPVTAAVFGLLVLQQTLTMIQVAGMVLILITVTVLSS